MTRTLLYVSRSLVSPADMVEAVQDIVACTQTRNRDLDVTGALVATAVSFAQILEGPGDAVETLMNSIRRDPRHTGIHVVADQHIDVRQFPGRALAYAGGASYVEGLIAPLLNRSVDRRDIHLRRLVQFIAGVAANADGPGDGAR